MYFLPQGWRILWNFVVHPNLRQILYRLKKKNEIVQIRQGFYAIIPPEYSKQGIIPPYLYIDDLMKSLDIFFDVHKCFRTFVANIRKRICL